jgi:predicted MFS family arabinose efflux permease
MLAILSFARLAMGFQFQSIAALSNFIGQDLKVNSSSIGLLIGMYMLPGVMVAFPELSVDQLKFVNRVA